MSRRATFLCCCVLLHSLGAWAQSRTTAPPEAELWPELIFSHAFTPTLNVGGGGFYHFSHNMTRGSDRYLGGYLNYTVRKWLMVSPAYRYNRSETGKNTLTHENRLSLDATLRLPRWQGFDLSDRHRGEGRLIDGLWSERYRNRLLLEHPLGSNGHTVTPYAAFEDFYDTRYGWNRTRVYAGARFPLARRLVLDTSYVHQLDGHAPVHDIHVLWVVLRVRL